jgi:hypothetical protein
MGVAHSSEPTPAHPPAFQAKLGRWSVARPEANHGVPSQRESNAAAQDERGGNDYHQSEKEEVDDSTREKDHKEQRRQGAGEATRRMLQ